MTPPAPNAQPQASGKQFSQLIPGFSTFLYWGIGALALIALANYQPKLAVWFVILLIAGVLLTHWSSYTGLFNIPATPTAKTQPTIGG